MPRWSAKWPGFLSATACLLLGSVEAAAVAFDVIVPTRWLVRKDITGFSTGVAGWLIATDSVISASDMRAKIETLETFPTMRMSTLNFDTSLAPLHPGEVAGYANNFNDTFQNLVAPLLQPGEVLKLPGKTFWGVFMQPGIGFSADEVLVRATLSIGLHTVEYEYVVEFVDMAPAVLIASTQRLSAVPQPAVSVEKSWVLVEDLDQDARVDAGDSVEYKITVSSVGPGAASDLLLMDAPAEHSTLSVGSVRTDSGVVTTGNDAGDAFVAVNIGLLEPGEVSTTTYEVLVDDPLPDGVIELASQATLVGEFGSMDSDDPFTPAIGDPTRVPLANSALDRCEDTLDSREASLAVALQRVEELERALEEFVCEPDDVDSDQDGVPDYLDSCHGTPPGSLVDLGGCTRGQFCSAIDVDSVLGVARCATASWSGDGGSELGCRIALIGDARRCEPLRVRSSEHQESSIRRAVWSK